MNFDRIAPHYDWLEAVLACGELQDCRTAYPEVVKRCRHALLVGEGHGRFLEWCLRETDMSKITCMDASAEMLKLARRRAYAVTSDIARVLFIQGDLLSQTPPHETYDLIATHFFLDCFSSKELPSVVARIARAAMPETSWLISDFCIPGRGWRRLRARGIHWLMYRFFRATTQLKASHWVSPDSCLKQQGFELLARRTQNWGLLHADHWRKT